MNKKNSVQLLGWYGGDVINACSAWTSTSRDLTEDKVNRIPKLLKMLADNGHETPFEKSIVHFLVDTEICSHIHLLKHRISSLNAESARYKELKEDKYYIPDDWSGIKCNISNVPVALGESFDRLQGEDWNTILEDYTQLGNILYHQCLKDLEPVLGRKRAKESARLFKAYNSQIQSDVMFNWRSFVNFQKLRNCEHAQKEIREVAQKMLDLVKGIEGNPFEHTIAAFEL
jgi:thymidylate synthase (FAD)